MGPEVKTSRGAMPTPSVPKLEPKVEVQEVVEPKVRAHAGGPIQVVATRAGFFGLVRRVEGDKFTIDHEGQMGDWMKKI